MSPAPRLAVLVAGAALLALVAGAAAGALAAAALLGAAAADALAVRSPPRVRRRAPMMVARGTPAPFTIEAEAGAVRQPLPPDVELLDGALLARRRGRHILPPVAVRRTGPLGLGRWDHGVGEAVEVLAYPDLPAARRLALAARQGRLRDPGRRPRGPLGLGTEFEAMREYAPDDDLRAVNWAATARVGRPMSNTYRIEQEREIVLLVDAGRLMAAPLGDATRLDLAVDAAVAVAAVADALGDRCGVLAFDGTVRRHLPPRRAGGRAVARAVFDLEPSAEESDYELAFRTVAGGKRALIMVLTDLVEETAARPLASAVPVLARRHAIVVAGARDDDLHARVTEPPETVHAAYAAAAAVEVLAARDRAAALLGRAGARTVEAPAPSLAATCVSAYLREKARARL